MEATKDCKILFKKVGGIINKCPCCGHKNIQYVRYCEECGFSWEKYFIQEFKNMKHDWVNDPMFEAGAVIMLTNDNPQKELGEEMRQQCVSCGHTRFIAKTEKPN